MKKKSPVQQRQTKQRQIILKVLEEAAGPLQTHEVLEKSKKELKEVGIATVYRTLKLLSESSLVNTINLPGGETCYELSERKHHDHFVCKRCHKVFDLDFCLLHLPPKTVLPGGFCVENHEATLFGTCPQCYKFDN